ncbi:unnamed protein product [Adineta steineri]|uniref:Glycosyltransferase 61 catalytic domain-containing protein n=1 Tax=Adineta steineri TaxID=433720 RepID=A0A816CL14_9BILA|nr:unnamed protein product [Adineta steineri]CAF1626373.1 unnamed protein product [Adineta steineri]
MQSLCYDINSGSWQTSALPFSNWSGVSLRSRGSLFRDAPIVSRCNSLFFPQLKPLPSAEYTHWMKGTVVMSCIWVNVFGHIFLEMMLPAWMATRSLADHFTAFDMNVAYILDNRCNASLAGPSFSLLSHQPVLQLQDLIYEHKKHRKSHLCFEKLIVGYRLQSSLEYAHNVAHLKDNDLSRYRDAVKTLHKIPRQVNMSPGVCIALVLQRRENRKIVPDSEKKIVKMLRERTLCAVKIVIFDNMPILEQVRLVASASIFVHVSGSGSHHFIWLADGAASLTIVHPFLGLNVIGHGGIGGGGLALNDFLCWKHSRILCVTAGATTTNTNAVGNLIVDTYSFSNALDMIKLWQYRGVFDPRDPSD